MRSYSVKAKRALAHFFRPFNDIEVYVEDTSSRNFYELFVNRILDGNARVSRVFQLGGKDQVIEMCANDQEDDDRARLYIIDGDMDILLGATPPELKHLHRLNVYSCENLVLCREAVHQVCYENAVNDQMSTIETLLDYSGFISEIESEILELFIVYAAVNELDPAQQTVGYHVFQLCNTNIGQPHMDSSKVRNRRQTLMTNLSTKFSLNQIDTIVSRIRCKIADDQLEVVHVASGKSYILPLLWAHLKQVVHYRGTLNTLLVQLARHCRLDIDPYFVDAIRDASKCFTS